MAGAKKHMERSHRSHKNATSVFNNFYRHAYKVEQAKAMKPRLTLGEKLKSLLPKRKTEGGN